MKLIDDIRRENLEKLAAEFGGVAGLARKLDRSESQVSQWIRGAAHSVTGRKRGMKSETARWIEATTNCPPGWLDISHETSKLPPQDRAFVLRVEEEVARYIVPPQIRTAIITLITTQERRRDEDTDSTAKAA